MPLNAVRYVVPYGRIELTLGLSASDDSDPFVRHWSEIVQVIRFLIYPTQVLEAWYVERYADVARALANSRWFDSPTHHFLTVGYFEGRSPSPPGSKYFMPRTFNELKANFTILPTRSGVKVRFNRNDLASMIRDAIICVPVDEQSYLFRYKDVAAAVEGGRFASAREHYLLSGYMENRIPYNFEFDADWYVKNYNDVAGAASANPDFDAQRHFEYHGYKEGRWPRGDALLWLSEFSVKEAKQVVDAR